jgi:hypothetical protein
MNTLAPPLNAAGPAPKDVARTNTPAQDQKRGLSGAAIFGIAATLLLVLGWVLPTERYITPKRGTGYWLGIVGGGMMLILFLYSARKRVRWLGWMGAISDWFRLHMVLGIVGPLCILYHSNFSLGATNSNIALLSMLLVAASGVVGRYIYARIRNGLSEHGATLELLRSSAHGLRALSVSFLPELLSRLEKSEDRLLSIGPGMLILGFAKPAVLWLYATSARWRLHSYICTTLRVAAKEPAAIAGQRTRLRKTACAYVDRRLASTLRVARSHGYERLFSLWHSIHVPLILMLVVAGVVHVIAVHVY